MMHKDDKFWPSELTIEHHFGIKQEMRTALAWELIKTHPNVAGVEAGEDSSGRSKLKLQTPEELVSRSFEIADIFVTTAIERGDFKAVSTTPEEKATKTGQLAALHQEETYSFVRKQREEAKK